MMKCKRAKQEMALCAGRDLDPVTEQELRRHLANCPGCHEQWNRICSTTSVLQQAGFEAAEMPAPQLWPSVSRNLREVPRRPARSESFSFSNALVPLVAVASLILAVVSIRHSLRNPPPNYQPGALLTDTAPFPHTDSARAVEFRPPVIPRSNLPEASTRVVSPPSSPINQYYRDRELYRLTPASAEMFVEPLPIEARLNRE